MTNSQLNQLYRYAISLTNNEENAYDLVQSAIEKCLKIQSLSELPMNYFRATIRNLFIDQCRRNQIVSFDSLEEEFPLILVDNQLESLAIDSQLITKLLAQLAATEREVLFLWAVEEYTAQEIADELQCSRNTILSRLHRVKKKAKLIIENIETSAVIKGV